MQVIEKIISNFTNNQSLYIGENVTMSQHMIQAAMLAEKAKCKKEVICSCLLHDYYSGLSPSIAILSIILSYPKPLPGKKSAIA